MAGPTSFAAKINRRTVLVGSTLSGPLIIQGHRDGGRLRLSVADRGPGVARGFDIAGRGGLGLNILRAIARQLDARLEAENDHGARFTLTLPLPAQKRQDRSFAPR